MLDYVVITKLGKHVSIVVSIPVSSDQYSWGNPYQ